MNRLPPDRHGDPVRATFDLVAPLAHEATAKHTRDTTGYFMAGRSRAVSALIDQGLRCGDVDSANPDSTRPTATTPGTRPSRTATRTTGTRTTTIGRGLSADEADAGHADFSFHELTQAYFDCREHKRNTRSALAFEQDLERNLSRLYDELRDGSYRPGPSICFVITRPKAREVWAADFRDRIVHHLLYNRISPRFYRSFVADSCACIPGRGTLYGAERLESKVRSVTQNWSRPAWYLKCDIANFFVSIDKTILRGFLGYRIREPFWLRLAETILFHDPRPGVVLHSASERLKLIPAYKSLFNKPDHLGLPIGNLSSQFFANVYMDALDQFVKHRLRIKHYIRYVDDFVLLHESPQTLNKALADIRWFLPRLLSLQLNDAKTIIQPVDRGIDFVGQVIKPWRRTLRRRTMNDALHRIRNMDDADLYESANSYFGLLRQTTHSRRDRIRLAKSVMRRGRAVDYDLTKTYRRHA
jgi:RNA-directed DNA polymerase